MYNMAWAAPDFKRKGDVDPKYQHMRLNAPPQHASSAPLSSSVSPAVLSREAGVDLLLEGVDVLTEAGSRGSSFSQRPPSAAMKHL